jgi:hypothetical protein
MPSLPAAGAMRINKELASRTRTNGLRIWRAWRGLKKAPAKLKILRRQSALRPLCLNSPLEMAEI